MDRKDAFYLLFEKDYGKGSLFKNQIDLVNELLNSPVSAYFILKGDIDNYNRALSRLKAYISQLFSEDAKRNITLDFKYTLELLLKQKLEPLGYNEKDVLDLIIEDLQFKNVTTRNIPVASSRKFSKSESKFFENLLDAKHITVFTTREINIEFNILNRRQTFIDLLIENLFDSLLHKTTLKRFRFNFPMENTCKLFWRGLEKEIVRFSENDSRFLATVIPLIIRPDESLTKYDSDINFVVTSRLLEYLSGQKIISVFYLTAPVYNTPLVALNPNDPFANHVYLVLQSASGEDQIQQLSNQDVYSWRLFVWDYLKSNHSGKEISYSISI